MSCSSQLGWNIFNNTDCVRSFDSLLISKNFYCAITEVAGYPEPSNCKYLMQLTLEIGLYSYDHSFADNLNVNCILYSTYNMCSKLN